jgi:hypothetical protein
MEERLEKQLKEEADGFEKEPVSHNEVFSTTADTKTAAAAKDAKANNVSWPELIEEEEEIISLEDHEVTEEDDDNEDHPDFDFQVSQPQDVPVRDDKLDNDKLNNVLIKRQSKDETTVDLDAEEDDEDDVKSRKVDKANANAADNVVEALTDIFNKLLTTQSSAEFDLDLFTAKVMKKDQYRLDSSWYADYFVMSCPAQSFAERLSLQGEFFEKYV